MIGIMKGFLFFVFAISVVSVIIAGFQYVMNGSSHQAEKAKMKIIYSSIGMMFLLMASAVMSFFPEVEQNTERVVANANSYSTEGGYSSKKQIVVEDKKIVEESGFASTSYICVIKDGYTDILFTKAFGNHIDAENFCGGFNLDYRYTVGVTEEKDHRIITEVYY